MANGKLEIDGLDELIKKYNEFKTLIGESVDVLAKVTKAMDTSTKSDLANAKSVTELNKQIAIQTKTENEAALAKIKIEKETIALKKATQDLTKATSEQNKLTKAQIILSDESAGTIEKQKAELSLLRVEKEKLRKEDANYNQELKRIIDRQNELANELKKTNYETQKNFWAFGQTTDATMSLRQESKLLTMELTKLAVAGERDSQQYKEMVQRLGDIKDSMADVANEAKILGSDTRNIDMAVGSVEAFGSAAQVAEGSMQLLGSQNEDVTKGIQRLMAMQSIMNGVQQIGNALQKESAFMMGLDAASTKIAAVAKTLFAKSVGTSTGALKAFKVALLATGIGAIIVGIGLLVANWDKLFGAVGNSVNALKEFEDQNKKIIDAENGAIEVAKKKGALQSEIIKREIYNNDTRLEQIDEELEKADLLRWAENLTDEQRKENHDKIVAWQGEEMQLKQKNRLLEIDLTNALKDESDKLETKLEDDFKKDAERNRKIIEENKKLYESKLKSQNDYWNEVRKLGKTDLELENIEYAERLDKAFVFGQDLSNLTAEEYAIYEQLLKAHLARIAEIHANADEAEKERLEKNYQDQVSFQEKAYNDEYDRLTISLGNKEITQEVYDERSKNIERGNLLWKIDTLIEAHKDATAAKAALANYDIQQEKQTGETSLQNQINIIKKKEAVRLMELDMIQGISETIGALAKKDSAAAIAAFAVQKALAIARVWVQTAASNAIITAEAGAAAIPTLGASILGGISLIAANNIMAGIQTGLIAAQTVAELQGFAKGTDDAPGGLAFVGERGRELVTLPDGSKYLTPNSATLTYLPQHSEVTPAHLVEKELRDTLKMQGVSNVSDNALMLELISTIKSKPSASFSINQNGIYVISRKGASKTNWLNNTYRGTC